MNLTQAALEALQSSKEGAAQSEPRSHSGDHLDEAEAPSEDAPKEPSDESSEVEVQGEQEPQESDQSEEVPEELPSTEEVYATDDTGKIKIQVDYQDRAKIKRAYQMEASARKYKSERDRLAQTAKELQEVKKTYDSLNDTYKQDGVLGLVKMLGGQEALEEYVSSRIAKEQELAAMSPDERAAYDRDEELNRLRLERDAAKQAAEDEAKRIQELTEQREREALESKLHPAFDRYRMAGQLGNEEHEDLMDSLIWRRSLDAIDALPEGTDVTHQVVGKIFKRESEKVKSLLGEQVKRKSAKQAQTRKVAAAESVQVATKKGTSSNSKEERIESLLKSGNVLDAAKAFFGG